MREEKEIGQQIGPKENAETQQKNISILDIHICVCNDGTMGLFKKRRVFDINYSMSVDVYEGLGSKKIAILGRSGDKVFPEEKWLGKEEYIETREKEIIQPNCSITNKIQGKDIVSSMKGQGAIFHFNAEELSPSEMEKIVNYACRQFSFEKQKQKLKKKD